VDFLGCTKVLPKKSVRRGRKTERRRCREQIPLSVKTVLLKEGVTASTKGRCGEGGKTPEGGRSRKRRNDKWEK